MNKKKLMALLLVVMPMLCFAQWDNNQAQFPEANFRSVNTYSTGTSYQPQITHVGSTTVYSASSNTNNAPYRAGQRRNGVNPGSDTNDPYATPVGDVPIIFMIVFVFLFQYFKNYYYGE